MPVDRRELTDGWSVARSEPGECAGPADTDGLRWLPAAVPGTAAGALGDAAAGLDVDAFDWWFATDLAIDAAGPADELILRLEGLATVAEVWVDSDLVLRSESMFAVHELDLDRLRPGGRARLTICCRALAPLLARRRRPRARWRTKIVAEGNLRFYRTTLLGRAPGFARGPAIAGPWRPVSVLRRRGLVADEVALRPSLRGDDGVVTVRGRLRALGGAALPETVTVSVGDTTASLPVVEGEVTGEVTVPGPRRWWPHTHGEPVLHPVSIAAAGETLHEGRVGFRTLQTPADIEADGMALTVNGVELFARGAVWAPLSLTDPHGSPSALRAVLAQAVAAGLNLLRVPGMACWESAAFHDLCDELGILVWQDCMFANLDYPESDPEFMATAEAEVRAQLAGLAGRPSLAVVCGSSEVAQQVAMLGLDPALAEGPLYGELLPRLVAESGADAGYVPSSPWGGSLPSRTSEGITHYFGVSAYLRPLTDARRAELRFASECLAFANVPDDEAVAELGMISGPIVDAAWKAGVPRDHGVSWDFDDVRDHYLRSEFGVDPLAVRYEDPDRYLALSRQLTGELLAETLGEWRRARSPCRGAIVLWLKDLAPGAGWGLLDDRGRPKLVLAHVARACAPVAVWTTDEGLNGLAVHVANDAATPLRARLRVVLYREDGLAVDRTERELTIDPHGGVELEAEALLGRFVDIGHTYRFGPAHHDAVVVALHGTDGALLAQAVRFPTGRPLSRHAATELGATAGVRRLDAERATVTVAGDRLLYGVRVHADGWRPDDDGFVVEPGRPRELTLHRVDPGAADEPAASITALNLSESVRADG